MPGISPQDISCTPSGRAVAVPFDPKREEVTGAPVPVVEGVRRGAFASVTSGVAQFSVSETGSLV